MKSYTKKQLAQRADVSQRTFARWLARHREELTALGVSPNDRIMPPKVVAFISEMYGIEL